MQQPYIYKITDLRNGMKDIGQHNGKDDNYFTSSIIVNNIIKKHGKEEAMKFLKKEIIVQGDFNQYLLNELEKHYIRLYNTKAPHGYNLTDGGEGVAGLQWTEDQIKNISEKIKNLWQNPIYKAKMAKIHSSPEFKNKVSKLRKGKKNSPDHIAKSSAGLKGRVSPRKGVILSEEQLSKMRIKINQFTVDGKFIKTWPSIHGASKALGIKRPNILSVLKNKKKSAGGFIWRYVEKEKGAIHAS